VLIFNLLKINKQVKKHKFFKYSLFTIHLSSFAEGTDYSFVNKKFTKGWQESKKYVFFVLKSKIQRGLMNIMTDTRNSKSPLFC